MLYEILRYLRNFFADTANRKEAAYTISSNSITPSLSTIVKTGQYFLIEGSTFNDGVHRLTDAFENETFTGTITPLKIPADLLALVAEIEEYNAKQTAAPFESESFGGYSYTRAKDANGNLATWKTAYGTRLNAWRKL